MPTSSLEAYEQAYSDLRADLELLFSHNLRQAEDYATSVPLDMNFCGVTRDDAVVSQFRQAVSLYLGGEIENFAAILLVRGTSGVGAREALRKHYREIAELLPQQINVRLRRLDIDSDVSAQCCPSDGETMADLLSLFETFFWEIENMGVDAFWPGTTEIGLPGDDHGKSKNIGAPWYSFLHLTSDPMSQSEPGASSHVENNIADDTHARHLALISEMLKKTSLDKLLAQMPGIAESQIKDYRRGRFKGRIGNKKRAQIEESLAKCALDFGLAVALTPTNPH